MGQILDDIKVESIVLDKEDIEELLEGKRRFCVGDIEIGYELLVSEISKAYKKLILHYAGENYIQECWKEKLRTCEKEIRVKNNQKEKISNSIVDLKKDFMNYYLDRVKGILTEKEFSEILETVNCEKMKLEKRFSEFEREEKLAIRKVEELGKIGAKEFVHLTKESFYLFVNQIEIYESGNDNEKTGKQVEIIVSWDI